MHDLLLALDPWSLPAHMRLFFIGMALLGLAGGLARAAVAGTGRSLMLSIWPLALFGGFFGYTAYKARTGVITAHHAVTGAFMATLRPAAGESS
jgi:hypothetical protein